MARLLANAGPTTAVLEVLASAIGGGLVVGGFAGGLVAFLSGRPRCELEKAAVKGSYIGGGLGFLLLAFDTLEKHFV